MPQALRQRLAEHPCAAIATEGTSVLPRANAVAWEAGHPRTPPLAAIQKKRLAQWKRDAGDHRRSLAENAMFRLKQLLGDAVASRQFDAQVSEVHARLAAMNTMTDLGMPTSVRVGGCVLKKRG